MKHTLLNKKRTLMLHSVAILMMIYHHIFINGNTWFVNEPKSLFFIFNPINMGLAFNAQQTFAWFCRICVSIFAFTSGYGMYVQYENRVGNNINILEMYKYAFKRILSFFKKYALMFVIFIGLELHTHAIEFEQYQITEYILSFFGLSYTLNFTWWYVSQYYFMVLLSPLFYVILNKFKLKHYISLLLIFILGFIIAYISGYGFAYLKFFSKNIQTQLMMFVIIFAEGMFVGHFNLMDYLGNKINWLISLLIIVVVYLLRINLVRAASDSLFDLVLIFPFVLALTKLFSYIKKGEYLFTFLGKYSTYMWFVHAYFYAYMFFRLVIKSDYSLFVYIQTVVYSLVTAILLTNLENLIFNHLFKKK